MTTITGALGVVPSDASKLTFASGVAVATDQLDKSDSIKFSANHVVAQGLGHTEWVQVVGATATCDATLMAWLLGDSLDGTPELVGQPANWIPTDAVFSQQWEDLQQAGVERHGVVLRTGRDIR